MAGMLQWLCVLGCVVAAYGEVVEVTEGAAGMELLYEVMRSEDEANLVLLYDSTSGGGAYARKVFTEAEPQLNLYADCYAVDIAVHKLKWIAKSINMPVEPGYAFLFYGTSLNKSPKDPFKTPGGIKKPLSYVGPLGNLKPWVQLKLPEPRGLRKVAPKTEEEILKKVGQVDGDVLVVYSDKDKVTAALRAVCIRAGRSVAKIILATVKSPKPFGVEKLPVLVMYTEAGEKKVHDGKMERAELEAFLARKDKPTRMSELLDADRRVWAEAVRKFREPVLRIATTKDWESLVLNEMGGLVLVAFVDVAEDAHLPLLKVLTEISRKHATLRAVTWVSTANAGKLMEHFSVEPGSLVFVSRKADKYIKFTGSQSVKGISRFIEGPLAKSRGARDLGDLPPFTDTE